MCGCVTEELLSLSGNITVCSVEHLNCTTLINLKKMNKTAKCNCLPGCWDISYASTVSATPIFEKSALPIRFGLHKSELTELTVYFPHSEFRGYYKTAQVSFTVFLCEFEHFRNSFNSFEQFQTVSFNRNFHGIDRLFFCSECGRFTG